MRRTARLLPWFGGLLFLAAVILVARHFSEARDFAKLAQQAEPWWLLLAVVLQAGTYLAQAQVFRAVALRGHVRLELGTAYALSLVKLFGDQALPSGGWSGTFVVATGLGRRRVARPVAAAAVVVELVSRYAASVVGLVIAVVVSTVRGKESGLTIASAVAFVVFAAASSVFVLSLSSRVARAMPRTLRLLRPVRTALTFVSDADPSLAKDPRLLAQTTGLQLVLIFLDASTLWVLILSLGSKASPGGVFAGFMVSSLLRVVGIMPGALGTFDAALVVTLRAAGLSVAAALAATLLYRGLSFWLPMLPGLWLSRRELALERARPTTSARFSKSS